MAPNSLHFLTILVWRLFQCVITDNYCKSTYACMLCVLCLSRYINMVRVMRWLSLTAGGDVWSVWTTSAYYYYTNCTVLSIQPSISRFHAHNRISGRCGIHFTPSIYLDVFCLVLPILCTIVCISSFIFIIITSFLVSLRLYYSQCHAVHNGCNAEPTIRKTTNQNNL